MKFQAASGSLTQMRTRVPVAVQEITAVANPGQVRAAGQTTAQVITTTTLTPAQLVAGQRTGVVTATSVAAGKYEHGFFLVHLFTYHSALSLLNHFRV